MTSPSRIKIGFIGAGFMGQCAHLRNYASLPDECEITALAELRPELGAAVCRRHAIPRWYASAAELIATEKVDALVVSQHFFLHGQTLPAIAWAGIPVFCEKPIGRSIAAGEKIASAFEEAGTWLMVGYHKRCDPATIHALTEINALRASGELGPLRYVRIAMPPGDWIARGDFDYLASSEKIPDTPTDPAPADMDEQTAQDYDSFVNYYIHQVNLLRHLLGEDYSVSYADPSKILLVGHSRSGVTVSLEMASHETTIDWQETVFVAFQRGHVQIRLPAPVALNRAGEVEIFKDPGSGRTPQFIRPQMPWEHAMRRQARSFLQAVRGEVPVPCGAREAVRDLQIARDYFRKLKGI